MQSCRNCAHFMKRLVPIPLKEKTIYVKNAEWFVDWIRKAFAPWRARKPPGLRKVKGGRCELHDGNIPDKIMKLACKQWKQGEPGVYLG